MLFKGETAMTDGFRDLHSMRAWEEVFAEVESEA